MGMVIFGIVEDDVKAVNVPPRMRLGHDYFLRANSNFIRGSLLVSEGIDNMDVELILQGQHLFLTGSAYLVEAGDAWQLACK